jgi:predicted nuclease of predicted toxin-antitoxin system
LEIIRILEQAGHNTRSILLSTPGIADTAIIELANKEARLIITFDRDFGKLIFRNRQLPAEGIIYLRTSHLPPAETGALLVQVLRSGWNFRKKISILSETKFRQREF